MTRVLTNEVRSLLEAPLRGDAPTTLLGRALWLYIALIAAASDHGLVIRRSGQLAKDLSVPDSAIERWLRRLVQAKLIEILSPLPYLTVRLAFWPAGSRSLEENHQATGGPEMPAEPAAAATTKQQQGVGGQGEGEDLGRLAARVLGEADAVEVRALIAKHSAATVRRALEQVESTPTHRIRKSRLALFRYLLGKFSETIDVRDL